MLLPRDRFWPYNLPVSPPPASRPNHPKNPPSCVLNLSSSTLTENSVSQLDGKLVNKSKVFPIRYDNFFTCEGIQKHTSLLPVLDEGHKTPSPCGGTTAGVQQRTTVAVDCKWRRLPVTMQWEDFVLTEIFFLSFFYEVCDGVADVFFWNFDHGSRLELKGESLV